MIQALQTYVIADREACVGCKACELACFAVHNQKENNVGKTVGTITVPITPKLHLTIGEGFRAPIQCRHCEDAPCLNACAPKAISRKDRRILITQALCDGCKDCILACPFGAIEMHPISANGAPVLLSNGNEAKKAASKCDLCISNTQGPACVRVCPHKALRLVRPEAEMDEKRICAAEILAVTN